MNGTQNEKYDTLLSNSLAFIKPEISHLFPDKAVSVSNPWLKSIFQSYFICCGKIKLFVIFMFFHQNSKTFFLLQQNFGIILPLLIRPFWWSVLCYFNHSKIPKIVEPTKTCNTTVNRNIPSFLGFLPIRPFQTIGFFPLWNWQGCATQQTRVTHARLKLFFF